MKKGPVTRAFCLGSRLIAALAAAGMTLHRADFRSRGALGALRRFEFHGLAFFERLEAGALDLGVVGEEVFAAVIRRDESKTLLVVEPLYFACSHLYFLTSNWTGAIPTPETGHEDQGRNLTEAETANFTT